MQAVRQFDLFGQLQIIGDTESKLIDLYHQNPIIFNSIKRTLIEYWKTEGLGQVLGDILPAFESWWLSSATTSETLTRCIRSLKERGVIELSDQEERERKEAQELYRDFYARRKSGNRGQGLL